MDRNFFIVHPPPQPSNTVMLHFSHDWFVVQYQCPITFCVILGSSCRLCCMFHTHNVSSTSSILVFLPVFLSPLSLPSFSPFSPQFLLFLSFPSFSFSYLGFFTLFFFLPLCFMFSSYFFFFFSPSFFSPSLPSHFWHGQAYWSFGYQSRMKLTWQGPLSQSLWLSTPKNFKMCWNQKWADA